MEKELNLFIENYSYVLNKQKVDFEFFVIYQTDNKLFNKGLLNNIGFLYVNNEIENNKYLLFNDVTTYPKKETINENLYNFNRLIEENNVYNPYGYIHCLGKLFLVSKNTFLKQVVIIINMKVGVMKIQTYNKGVYIKI